MQAGFSFGENAAGRYRAALTVTDSSGDLVRELLLEWLPAAGGAELLAAAGPVTHSDEEVLLAVDLTTTTVNVQAGELDFAGGPDAPASGSRSDKRL